MRLPAAGRRVSSVASCASNASLFVIAPGIGEGSRNAPRLKMLILEGEPPRAPRAARPAYAHFRGEAMGQIFWNEYYRLLDSGENVDVLAIGDSWFHYPANNLITPLHRALERPTIYVIGENGARADELARGSWLANFQKMLSQYPSIRLVSISAGGNDSRGSAISTIGFWRPIAAARPRPARAFARDSPMVFSMRSTVAYRVLDRRGGGRADGRCDPRSQLRLRDPGWAHAARHAELAQAADGQRSRPARRRAVRRHQA